jgi:hypothetical protein
MTASIAQVIPDSQKVLRKTYRVQNNGDEISPHGRYKNGTSPQAFFAFPSLPYRALQCDHCLVITTFWSLFAPFHGGNTGSNPVGDANHQFSVSFPPPCWNLLGVPGVMISPTI